MKKTVFILFFILSSKMMLSQTRVEQSKSELKSGSQNTTTQSNSTQTNTTGTRKENTNNNPFKTLFVDIGLAVFKYGFIGNYRLENHLYNPLAAFPYQYENTGNFNSNDSLPDYGKNWRIDVEDQFLYSDSNLYANHLKIKLRPFQYFYLQTDYHEMVEKDAFTGEKGNLSVFQFNLNYDRLRLKNVNIGWNIGATYVANDVKKAGLCFGVNMDVFPVKPISLSAAAKWSTINSQPVNHFEVQLKYHIKKYFLNVGFEHYTIGSPNYNFIAAGGGIYF